MVLLKEIKKYLYNLLIFILFLTQSYLAMASDPLKYSKLIEKNESMQNFNLFGEFKVNPMKMILENRIFDNSNCELYFKKNIENRVVKKESYGLTCYGLNVDGIDVSFFKLNEVLQLVYSNIEKITHIYAYDWKQISNIELNLADFGVRTVNLIKNQVCIIQNMGVPCKVITGIDQNGYLITKKIDLRNLNVIDTTYLGYDLAQVYEFNSEDGVLINHEFDELLGNGFLESKNMRVFSENLSNRLYSEDNNFYFDPLNESMKFHQIQAYYGLIKAKNWFQSKLKIPFSEQFDLIVDGSVNGSVNNAIFIPSEVNGSHQIILGAGDGKLMNNLSLDNDVVAHELSHYVIYKFIPEVKAVSGIVHEAYADYFAYAMTNNPYLGESVKIGYPWLRSAKISEDIRIDKISNISSKHLKGEVLSSILWDFREQIGEDADNILYNSLRYLPTFDLEEYHVFIAIFHAIEDYYKSQKNLTLNNKTDMQCGVLQSAIKRGYVSQLVQFKHLECSIDWEYELLLSESYRSDNEESSKDVEIEEFLPSSCGVIFQGKNKKNFWILLLFLPMFINTKFSLKSEKI